MQGRQAGDVVLFQGTADLGEKDGGILDWIGRATEDEFVGFYTSQEYTGHFRLARSRPTQAADSDLPHSLRNLREARVWHQTRGALKLKPAKAGFAGTAVGCHRRNWNGSPEEEL